MSDIITTTTIICPECKCSLDYDVETKINPAGTEIKRTLKVYQCDSCIRNTFDEAQKIVKEKARQHILNEDYVEDEFNYDMIGRVKGDGVCTCGKNETCNYCADEPKQD